MCDWKWPMPFSFSFQFIINFSMWVVYCVCMYDCKWPINVSPFSSQFIMNFSLWVVLCVCMYDWKWPMLFPFPPNPLWTSVGELCFVCSCITGSDQWLISFPLNPLSTWRWVACVLCIHVWLELTSSFSALFFPFHYEFQLVSCFCEWMYDWKWPTSPLFSWMIIIHPGGELCLWIHT